MVSVSIIPATLDHVGAIAEKVRPADRDELWAASNITAERAMRNGIEHSEVAMTGLIDGVPVCMWGVVRESLVCNMGVPWMIGTELLDKYAATFLRRCRAPILEIFAGYDILVNHVDARNKKAIKWLGFMGFKVEKEPVTYGVEKLPFHRFSMGA